MHSTAFQRFDYSCGRRAIVGRSWSHREAPGVSGSWSRSAASRGRLETRGEGQEEVGRAATLRCCARSMCIANVGFAARVRRAL